MLLKDLSLDALQLITSYLSASHLCRLWVTGSKSLQSKLGNGGGVRHFEFSRSDSDSLVWPRIVIHFPRLVVFALCFDPHTYNSVVFGDQLSQLPASLESLTVRFQWSLHAVCGALMTPGFSLPNLKTLDISFEPVPYEGGGKKKPFGWPKTLTALAVRQRNFSEPLPLSLSLLPPHLTSLTFTPCLLTDCPPSHSDPTTRAAAFPATLTALHLDMSFLPAPPALFHALPSGLLHLTIEQRSGELCDAQQWEWSALPPGLQTLNFQAFNFTSQHCAQLPRTLTEIRAIEPENIDDIEGFLDVLPPKLKLVENLVPVEVTREVAMRLPRTLETWNVAMRENHVLQVYAEARVIPHLPPNTRSIGCRSLSLKPLETELKSMRLTQIPVAIQELNLATCIGLESLETLPKSLTSLGIFSGNVPNRNTYFSRLADFNKLIALDFSELKCSAEIQWEFLPRSLQTLLIVPPGVLTSENAELLPKGLTSLETKRVHKCEVHVGWFKSLPSKLDHLRMKNISSVICDTIHDNEKRITFRFPQELTSLCLDFLCTDYPWLIPSLVVSLPKSLLSCTLSLPEGTDSYVTEEDMQHLPIGLDELLLPKSSLLSDDFSLEHYCDIVFL